MCTFCWKPYSPGRGEHCNLCTLHRMGDSDATRRLMLYTSLSSYKLSLEVSIFPPLSFDLELSMHVCEFANIFVGPQKSSFPGSSAEPWGLSGFTALCQAALKSARWMHHSHLHHHRLSPHCLPNHHHHHLHHPLPRARSLLVLFVRAHSLNVLSFQQGAD